MRLVLRRYDRAGFLRSEPQAPAREMAALELLRGRAGAPEAIGADLDGRSCGEIVVLTTWLPGRPGPHDPPWPEAAAETLAEIHATEARGFPYRYRRYAWDAVLQPPPWTTRSELWRRSFDVAAGAPAATPQFIHRDFHQNNTLWDGSRIRVVDWTGACRGPAAVDTAHFRLNLHLTGRSDLEPAFVETYRRESGAEPEPHWDIVDAVDLLPWEEGETAVRSWRGPPGAVGAAARSRLEAFLIRALAAC
jgi:Ser/Thr protein kinase RdoA (MazF antagonist)